MTTLNEHAPSLLSRRTLGPGGVAAGGATMMRKLTVTAEAVIPDGVYVSFEEPTSDDEGIDVFTGILNADACVMLIGVMQAYLDGEAQLAAGALPRSSGSR